MIRPQWSDRDAPGQSALDRLVYRANLLGSDPSIVNWKGGNISAKSEGRDHAGRSMRVLWVKGSGSDMRTATRTAFAGLRLDEILPVEQRETMSDEEMVDHLLQCLLRPDFPRPSIETLLHAFLPFAHVDHTHPDAVIAFCTADGGEELAKEVFGDRVVWIPYQRPGFALSKAVAAAVRADPRAEAVFLAKHGLVTWGDDARGCYATTLRVIEDAEQAVAHRRRGPDFGGQRLTPADEGARRKLLRRVLPPVRGAVMTPRSDGMAPRSAGMGPSGAVLHVDTSPDVMEFVCSEQLSALALVGSACPDHLVHTKHRPCVVPTDPGSGEERTAAAATEAIARYADEYRRYVAAHRRADDPEGHPFPRVILFPGLAMVTTGPTKDAAMRTADLYHRAIAVMRGASTLSAFTSLTDREAYDVEYWPLELYKLTLAPPPRELHGRVALVTGGAGGIGRAVAEALAREGAHVCVLDIDRAGAEEVAAGLTARFGEGRGFSVGCDVTDEAAVAEAFDRTMAQYGGVDIVVSNAGLALSRPVEETTADDWDRIFAVLARGYFLVAREAFKIMKAQRRGGSVIFVTSKNALLAGKNSAAYNAAKAAEQHLMRSLAEEGGEAGIRVNAVAPDAVLRGSRIWSGTWRAQRARDYGIDEDQLEEFYRNRTSLKVNVHPEDVAEAVLFLASPRSAKTTGCTITVDGGVPGAYPR